MRVWLGNQYIGELLIVTMVASPLLNTQKYSNLIYSQKTLLIAKLNRFSLP